MDILLPKKEIDHNWVEERSRINSDCIKVTRTDLNAEMFFDPKGDAEIIERMHFVTQGQKAYGEWFKRLTKNEKAPRGKCGTYFAKNAHLKSNH